MMPETSKNRPTPLSAAGEMNVNRESLVGFFISSLALTIRFAPSALLDVHHPLVVSLQGDYVL
jgi:hypothetical protein